MEGGIVICEKYVEVEEEWETEEVKEEEKGEGRAKIASTSSEYE